MMLLICLIPLFVLDFLDKSSGILLNRRIQPVVLFVMTCSKACNGLWLSS